jgi:flagellar FliL protein
LLPIGAKPAEGETAHAQVKAGVMVPMRERIVNLSDTGILRYLKTSIVLEVFDPENPTATSKEEKKGKEELPKDLKSKAAPMEDKVTAILSAKTSPDLMGPVGKQHLKDEIKDQLNEMLHEERILSVYFTDFIIQ